MIEIKDLRKLREKAGLTQPQLAAKLDVHPATIHRWEKGEHVPHRWLLERLSEVLGQLLEDD
ncbi:hypothetical protein ES705_15157 [subsurface metagenome]|jgi:DNA-binding XRE family transcriptional regulator